MRPSIQLNFKSCPLAVNLLIRPTPPSLIQEHFIYMINAESFIKGFSSSRLLPPPPSSLSPLSSCILPSSSSTFNILFSPPPHFHPSLFFLPYQFLIENFSFACLPVWPHVQPLCQLFEASPFQSLGCTETGMPLVFTSRELRMVSTPLRMLWNLPFPPIELTAASLFLSFC